MDALERVRIPHSVLSGSRRVGKRIMEALSIELNDFDVVDEVEAVAVEAFVAARALVAEPHNLHAQVCGYGDVYNACAVEAESEPESESEAHCGSRAMGAMGVISASILITLLMMMPICMSVSVI